MSIALEQVSKHYQGVAAVNDVSVEIADGELFVLLGPSGSGKSTLLRAIAGLSTIDHGRIVLHGQDVSGIGAKDRGVGFVFQNYALFRHMTVGDNIEFALKARRVRTAERRRRRAELLKLVALDGMDDRLPSELSGGQQQRVAVARALAHEPRVLLLDEPFGALDARIRDELRRGIREIQRATGITTILVTHDQHEAFTLADRIGVMDRGRLQEVGRPRALYARPRTRFAATFLGDANLLLGQRTVDGVRIGTSVFPVDGHPTGAAPGAEATVVIRPEDIALASVDLSLAAQPIGYGNVVELEFAGSLERIRFTMATGDALLSARDPQAKELLIDASRSARESEHKPLAIGQRMIIGAKRIHVLATPIGSLRLVASNDSAETRLRASKLVRDLAQRLHITPSVHLMLAPGDDARCVAGLPVVALEERAALSGAVRLLRQGASQVLVVRGNEPDVRHLLICAQPTRAARDSALRAAGTLLRHMRAEATLLVASDEPDSHGARYRDLLDIRETALREHGIDLRTESFRGDLGDELGRRLDPRTAMPTLLLVGMTSITSGGPLIDGLEKLASSPSCAAILLTSAGFDAEQQAPAHAEPERRTASRGVDRGAVRAP